MKTVIVRGREPLPEPLREVIQRGSTAIQECRAPGPTPLPGDVDRVVFYAAAGDPDVAAAARQAARAERATGEEKLVYVQTPGGTAIDGLSPAEIYEWPRDEDRLKMAFMTGA